MEIDHNSLMILFSELFDALKQAKPHLNSDRIYDELAETLSYAKEEWEKQP